MTTRTPEQAIEYVKDIDKPFPQNLCKRKTREAFNIASDGSLDASEAWARTDHRVGLKPKWMPGLFAWWTGGSEGHGHVGFTDVTPGYVWSVDIKRPGHWDRVKVETISATWPRLKFVGYSKDIEGVTPPRPAVPEVTRVSKAVDLLQDARLNAGPRRAAVITRALKVLAELEDGR